jgi:hypothetical protein
VDKNFESQIYQVIQLLELKLKIKSF